MSENNFFWVLCRSWEKFYGWNFFKIFFFENLAWGHFHFEIHFKNPQTFDRKTKKYRCVEFYELSNDVFREALAWKLTDIEIYWGSISLGNLLKAIFQFQSILELALRERHRWIARKILHTGIFWFFNQCSLDFFKWISKWKCPQAKFSKKIVKKFQQWNFSQDCHRTQK